jgi:Poly A polymerase head domain
MRELAREILEGEEAWVVGGAVRDELLGRDVVDLDIACRDARGAARAFAKRSGGAPFPLSERHGAWRVALDGERTVDFTPLQDGIEDDLATRDFTLNAIAVPLAGGEALDPFGGRADLKAGVLRAVSPSVFADDPLRLLRAARLEDELGVRLDEETAQLVREHAALADRPAGERTYAELLRLSMDGLRRAAELGLLEPLGGSPERLERAGAVDSPQYRLVVVFGERLTELPVPNELRRYAQALLRAQPPADGSPRALHRFRRQTEPWALDALAYLGAEEHAEAVREARERDPAEPLLRGDELGVPEGPEVGRLLELVEEERAAGAITTREEALQLVRRELAEPSRDRSLDQVPPTSSPPQP